MRHVRLISRVWLDGDSFEAEPETPDYVQENDIVCESDEWSSAVDMAAEALREHGCTEPSSAPGFYIDLWYSDPDGSYVHNVTTGGRRENSGHLYGFDESDQQQIWQLLTGGR